MKTLALDIETYSDIDLKKAGAYAYSASPNFTILLLAYAFDNEPVAVIDLANGETIPHDILNALTSPDIVKTAYNANFERTCLAAYLKKAMPPEQWRCTAVLAATAGLPRSLAGVGSVLGLPEDKQKQKIGGSLIRLFCSPERKMPNDYPEKWELFKQYNAQDVVVEREIRERLSYIEIPLDEQRLWELDQKINDTGVCIDMPFIHSAIRGDTENRERLMKAAQALTGLENPNSGKQMLDWIEQETGLRFDSLRKEFISDIDRECDSVIVSEALRMRQELSKTSVKKYTAMVNGACPDGRIRGLLQFYGANRTGRWAGRFVQVQNLPKNKIPDLELARELVGVGDFEAVKILFGSIPETLSQLVRTAFIPSAGCRFIVSDFSAIEARVIAWLAGEKWRLQVFNSHGRIYEASAAQMFKVPIEKIVKGNPEYALRQKGKVAELALGYQGSKGALIQMGALDMGLEEEELLPLVSTWRTANPNIVRMWNDIESAAMEALSGAGRVPYKYGIEFEFTHGRLAVRLPSGRKLSYFKPRLEPHPKYQGMQITYEGTIQSGAAASGGWGRIPTYGGKLTENIVQAVARDCLAVAMRRLDKQGYKIVFHVHDEVIVDVPKEESSAKEIADIMSGPIKWAPGLPLNADAYECAFYRKD
ncbi:DNA polymerase [Christensenella massiliensis]|uniref:DNA-directed DNA polymerase n=1 Tax=Christensenella massiliensis TaxID=1805714 RepID=A0AAU8AB22_9FIRM